MTSPKESISQARLCACFCECMCQKAWIKSAHFMCHSTQTKAAQRRADTGPLTHSSALKDVPPLAQNALPHSQRQAAVAPNLFNLCNTPAPHSLRQLCSGPTVSDAQSPSVTLTFHLHKDRNDMALLYPSSFLLLSVTEMMDVYHKLCSCS